MENFQGEDDSSKSYLFDSQQAKLTLQEYLLSQLSLSDIQKEDIPLAQTLIGNINDYGYFEGSIPDIQMTSGASEKKIFETLEIIKSLDPKGCGSRSLKECLLSQMDKFEDSDVRKHMYTYEGGGKYHGLFLMGYQVNPSKNNPGGDKNWVALGGREYKGSIIYLSDCVARFALDGGVKAWNEKGEPLDADGKVMDRSQFSKLPSTIATGEEASLYRLLKRCPPVDILEYNNMRMRHPSMTPIARLTEVYYMLAECYLRDERKEDAAKLINQVRARYFEGGKDPNPVTAANLDKYRMLDEWMIEFLGEARRRTDLIRWDAYVTEKWWDHEPSNNKNWERFPISEKSLASNNLLVQNPGY
jgi:hypothetical protein